MLDSQDTSLSASGDNPETDNLPLELLDGGPQIGVRAPVGVGKTEAIMAHVKAILSADPAARVAFFAPDHALVAEAAERIRAAVGCGPAVLAWRGIEQPEDPNDPEGAAMCQRIAEARVLTRAGGTLNDLCRACPHNPSRGGACAYRAQMDEAKRARVLVMPHAMLTGPLPAPLKRVDTPPFDFVVVDEAFHGAMLRGFGRRPEAVSLDDLDASHWAAVPASGTEPPGWAAKRLQRVLAALKAAAMAASPGGSLDLPVWLLASVARDARKIALRCKRDVAPAVAAAALGDEKALRAALGTMGTDNARVLRVAQLLAVVAGVAAGQFGPMALTLGSANKAPAIRLRWWAPILATLFAAPHGIVHLDATMAPVLVRRWLPRLVMNDPGPATTPHMRLVQVEDSAVSYGAIIPAQTRSAKARAAAEQWVKDFRRLIGLAANKYRGRGKAGGPDVLFVGPKALVDDLRRTGLPSGAGAMHFGRLRGQDSAKGAALLIVVSRPLPPAREVETIAEVLSGTPVAAQGYRKKWGRLAMADGSQRRVKMWRHTDALAEALRWSACEAEVVQAIGRGRGVRRGPSDPLDVWLLTNLPMDGVTVQEAITLREARQRWVGSDPASALLSGGVVPMDWPGRAAVLRKAGHFTGAKDTADAAQQWFAKNPAAAAQLDAGIAVGVGGPVFDIAGGGGDRGAALVIVRLRSIDITSRQKTDIHHHPATSWSRFRYRIAGRRKGGMVAVAPWHPDPRVAAEAAGLGPLDEWATAIKLVPCRPASLTGRAPDG